jgi:vacuolar-type H+-ATPase subunit E/Vma4
MSSEPDGSAEATSDPRDGKTELLQGIERDASAEAAGIIRQAQTAADERRKAATAQAAAILTETRAKAQEAARAISRHGEQAAGVEARRITLRAREEITRRVLEEATRRLAGQVGEPSYRDVLKGWIVEAALGLNAPEAEVLASGPEMLAIDEALLAEAAREVKTLAAMDVRLHRSRKQPLARQGVVLTSSDGRTAFNNQVATRMERYQTEIRKLIHDSLSTASQGS